MANSLLMDQGVYDRLPETKKTVFVFTWLSTLETTLIHAENKVIRECQEDLIQQLLTQLGSSAGYATQKIIGRCLAKLIMTGDTLLLYTTVNTCNSLLKTREDATSTINGRLAAIICLGTIYKSLGMAIGRYFEDSVVLMAKLVKQSESQVRYETMHALSGLLEGLGSGASVCFKEIYKAAKSCMTDRVKCVRAAAAECLTSLVNSYASLHQNEVDTITSLCFRCMDGSSYQVRLQAARLLGHLMVKTQCEGFVCSGRATSTIGSAKSAVGTNSTHANRQKPLALDNVLSLLASGFLRGPVGFLMGSTASEMIKGTNTVNREVRVGISYAYIEFVTLMGPRWFGLNLSTIIEHCTGLLANARATPTQAEANFTRLCIGYILTSLYRRLLSDSAQLMAASHIISLLRQNLQQFPPPAVAQPYSVGSANEEVSSDLGSFVTGLRSCSTDSDDGSGDDQCPSEGGTSSRTQTVEPHAPTSGGGGIGLIRAGFGKSGLTRAQRLQQQQKQHVIICLFDQLTQLITWLDSLAAPLLEAPSGLVDLLMTALSHSSSPIRLASASCLHQLVTALTDNRFHMHLLDGCMAGLQQAKRSSPDAILGYSAAISAILPVIIQGGLPASKAKQIFNLADGLLRAANQNSRLTLSHTQAGWLLIGTCMTLGPTELVKAQLPRILQFWRNAFPRSARELEAERQRGDAFTWQVMLEARAGALCSMQSFLECCSSLLVTADDIHRLLPPIECALGMLGHLVDIVRIYGTHLRATACLIRHRLYRVLLLLPPLVYKSCYNILLRELVADFTLTDSLTNTTTSLLHGLCGPEENIASLHPGFSVQDIDHHLLEQHLQPFGGSVLTSHPEQDPAQLFLHAPITAASGTDLDPVEQILSGLENAESLSSITLLPPGVLSVSRSALPSVVQSAFGGATQKCTLASFHHFGTGPPPIIVSVIDSSIELFARIFPYTPVKHCVQIGDHFSNCIRLTKSTHREAVQLNVFVALLGALRRLIECKTPVRGDQDFLKSAAALIFSAVGSPCILLRCIASECLGRLAQVTCDPGLLSHLIQQTLDSLRTLRQPMERAGYCYAVGCLHRYVGALTTGQHLGTSVGALLTVAQDSSTPEVQVWALHALTLIADAGGPLFRDYVGPCLELVLQFLLKLNSTTVEIQCNLGRLLTALITTTGPDLQGAGASILASRQTYLLCCSILQASTDPTSHAESVYCFQRIHMFDPHLALSVVDLIPRLQAYLSSSHLALRRSAIVYLRQLSQKSSSQLYAQLTAVETGATETGNSLEAQLFSLLDVEIDMQMRRDIEEIILGLVQATASSRLAQWLQTVKAVLQAVTVEKQCSSEFAASTNNQTVTTSHELTRSRKTMGRNPFNAKDTDGPRESLHRKSEEEDPGRAQTSSAAGARAIGPETCGSDDDNADAKLGGSNMEGLAQKDGFSTRMSPRWSTRTFAVGCLRLVISVCARQAEAAGALVGPSPSQPLAVTSFVLAKREDRPSQLTESTATTSAAHFDLVQARNLSNTLADTGRNWLVLHLADLIQMAFVAATSESQQLRVAGLNLLRDVISRFGHVPDPDCPGERLLGQYQAQVSAALRPAFSAASSLIDDVSSPEPTVTDSRGYTSPEVTAIAYYACSTWISSGVARTPDDLRRFEKLLHQAFDRLLVHHHHQQALSHLSNGDQAGGDGGTDRTQAGPPAPSSSTSSSSFGHCDEAVTLQVLAFLRACADIYLVSVRQPGWVPSLTGDEDGVNEVDSQGGPGHWVKSTADRDKEEERETCRLLTGLLRPLMPSLVRGWLTGLQDHALLDLPDELASQRPVSHGFVTAEMMLLPVGRSTRQHYLQHWPVFLLTLSTWLQAQVGCVGRQQEVENGDDGDEEDMQALEVLPGGQQNFYLLLGLCLEAFSDTTVKPPLSTIVICLRSLNCLLSKPASRSLIFPPKLLEQPYELVRLLHRLIFTRDSVEIHQLCLLALKLILTGAEEHLCRLRTSWLSKESQFSQSESHLISTTVTAGSPSKSASTPPLPTSTSSGSMVTSLCMPSTSLIDADLYELAEGGLFSGGEEKNEDHGSSGAELSADGGLQPSRSLVLSALELIVSLLARYRPVVIADMRQWRAFASSQLASQPVSIQPSLANTVHCASNADIGGLLATALHCVELLPNLCAPRLLLSSLNLGNSRPRLPDGTATPTSDGDLLPVLLQLAVSIAQDVLLDPASLQKHRIASLLSDGPSKKPPDQHDQLPDIRSWLDGQACSQSTDGQEPEISSTGIDRGGAHQLEASSSRLTSLNRLIGWSAQQAMVAQTIVALLSRLASHRYPTLTMASRASSSVIHQVISRCPPSDPTGLLQPDSSSGSCCNGNGNVMDGPTGQPLDVAACQWYELVGSALTALLQHCRHLHRNSGNKQTSPDCTADDDACCLAALVLVCRIVAICPVGVLKTHNLHAQLIDHSCRYWRQGMCPGAREQAPHATDATLARPVERRICLSAIRLLAGHIEPAVRCSFIKALSPQIFYWLYEVSQRQERAPSEASPTLTVDQHQLLLCIDDAIDLLEYLIDCSEANGRQGLMIIILPMLCSLLGTGLSADPRWQQQQQQHLPFSADFPSTPLSAGIHMSALRHTVSMASRFPNEFRVIVSTLGGDLRGRLETAIKCSTAVNTAALGKRTGNPTHGRRTEGRAVIQLRTDFSGFGS